MNERSQISEPDPDERGSPAASESARGETWRDSKLSKRGLVLRPCTSSAAFSLASRALPIKYVVLIFTLVADNFPPKTRGVYDARARAARSPVLPLKFAPRAMATYQPQARATGQGRQCPWTVAQLVSLPDVIEPLLFGTAESEVPRVRSTL